jgi:hypothetical protein
MYFERILLRDGVNDKLFIQFKIIRAHTMSNKEHESTIL